MRISEKFIKLKENGEKALIIYVTGGDPDYEISKEAIKTIANSGADIIEIGIPFSDPVADGPTIQAASQRALEKGFSLKDAFRLVSEIREEIKDTPLLFMSYYNPIFYYGVENFAKKAKEVGLNGVIIPDLPPEEADELLIPLKGSDVDMIFLLAPTMTEERLEIVSKKASGFIYFVSVAGVTGTRTTVNTKLPELVKKVKEKSGVPVGVGFGVSTRKQVEGINEYADAVIVGSAVVKKVAKGLEDKEKMLEDLGNFIKELKGKK